jgi:hypothetical protein
VADGSSPRNRARAPNASLPFWSISIQSETVWKAEPSKFQGRISSETILLHALRKSKGKSEIVLLKLRGTNGQLPNANLCESCSMSLPSRPRSEAPVWPCLPAKPSRISSAGRAVKYCWSERESSTHLGVTTPNVKNRTLRLRCANLLPVEKEM